MTELSRRFTVPSNSVPFCSGHGIQRSCTANVNNSTGSDSFLHDLGTIILHFVRLCITFWLMVISIFYPFSFRKSAPVVWLDIRCLSIFVRVGWLLTTRFDASLYKSVSQNPVDPLSPCGAVNTIPCPRIRNISTIQSTGAPVRFYSILWCSRPDTSRPVV